MITTNGIDNYLGEQCCGGLMMAVRDILPDIQPTYPAYMDDEDGDDDAESDTVPVSALREVRDELAALIDSAIAEYGDSSGSMLRGDACSIIEYLGSVLQHADR